MKLEHFLTPYTKINSKWIKDLDIRPETIKLPEENIGKTLSDINHSRILYDPPPRILEIKAKINKWDLSSVQFSSVAQSCLTLCDPMNCTTSGLPVHHQLSEFTQTQTIESVMPSSHLILCCPLLLLPPIPPSIRVFSKSVKS